MYGAACSAASCALSAVSCACCTLPTIICICSLAENVMLFPSASTLVTYSVGMLALAISASPAVIFPAVSACVSTVFKPPAAPSPSSR